MSQHKLDNRYVLHELVGSGGMASVYRARDELLGREVAVKVLHEHYANDETVVERFRREARNMASLSHPNVVQVFDQGEDPDGTPYIAMEYVCGGTLKDRLASEGALDESEALEMACQMGQALAAAHERGIVHRDIKPQNVLLTESGGAKVTDFGIASAGGVTMHSGTSTVLGTVSYMSPEQALGEGVGYSSDLYSLGMVLYEMLTGELPYTAQTAMGVAMKHVHEEPPDLGNANVDASSHLAALVRGLVAKDATQRYGSARELLEDLYRVRLGLPPSVTFSADPDATRVQRYRGRRRRLGYASAVMATVVIGLMSLASGEYLPESGNVIPGMGDVGVNDGGRGPADSSTRVPPASTPQANIPTGATVEDQREGAAGSPSTPGEPEKAHSVSEEEQTGGDTPSVVEAAEDTGPSEAGSVHGARTGQLEPPGQAADESVAEEDETTAEREVEPSVWASVPSTPIASAAPYARSLGLDEATGDDGSEEATIANNGRGERGSTRDKRSYSGSRGADAEDEQIESEQAEDIRNVSRQTSEQEGSPEYLRKEQEETEAGSGESSNNGSSNTGNNTAPTGSVSGHQYATDTNAADRGTDSADTSNAEAQYEEDQSSPAGSTSNGEAQYEEGQSSPADSTGAGESSLPEITVDKQQPEEATIAGSSQYEDTSVEPDKEASADRPQRSGPSEASSSSPRTRQQKHDENPEANREPVSKSSVEEQYEEQPDTLPSSRAAGITGDRRDSAQPSGGSRPGGRADNGGELRSTPTTALEK